MPGLEGQFDSSYIKPRYNSVDSTPLLGPGSSTDEAGRLAKEFLLGQMKERGTTPLSGDTLPSLNLKPDAPLQESLTKQCVPGEVCQLVGRNAGQIDLQLGNLNFSYDHNSLFNNGLKLMQAAWLEGGRLPGLAIGITGSTLFFSDIAKFDGNPGLKNQLSILADGAMISSGTVRAVIANSGSFSSGLGYMGLGARLAISDMEDRMAGDRSSKNRLSLSSDAALFSAGLMKISGYGPKWLQAGLVAGAFVGRAVVPLIPDRIKYESK